MGYGTPNRDRSMISISLSSDSTLYSQELNLPAVFPAFDTLGSGTRLANGGNDDLELSEMLSASGAPILSMLLGTGNTGGKFNPFGESRRA